MWRGVGVEFSNVVEKIALAAAITNMLTRVKCASVGFGFRMV